VRGLLVRLAAAALAATAALAYVVDVDTRRRGLAVEIYLDVLIGLLLVALVAAIRSALPAGRELHRARRPRRARTDTRPQQLEWLERQVGVSRPAGSELPPQLPPLVRAIASAALARRHGVTLERDPDRARELVSDRIWQLIRPDDPVTELPPGGLRALVADLEAIR
jgi:hypothetical protein